MKSLTPEQRELLLTNAIRYKTREIENNQAIGGNLEEYLKLVTGVMDKLEIPDDVNVQPMTLPASLIEFGGCSRAVTAFSRRLNFVKPGQCPVTEISYQLQQEMIKDLFSGSAAIQYFWCPYVLIMEWGMMQSMGARAFVTRYGKAVLRGEERLGFY